MNYLSELNCPVCGYISELEEESYTARFACPQRDSDCEHTLHRNYGAGDGVLEIGCESNPFLKFQSLLSSKARCTDYGVDYSEVVRNIGAGLKKMGQPDFQCTPLTEETSLAKALDISGSLFIKNETGNVGGSHKARHLMGTLLHLESQRLSSENKDEKSLLAIYSCGNAALGASCVASAAGYCLKVFVPEDVNPVVEQNLNANGAEVNKIGRTPGEAGDPCYLKFQECLKQGAIPFSCSGPDNWSNIEGGETLGYELFTQLQEVDSCIDDLFVQVGGGALGSSTAQAMSRMNDCGVLKVLPRFHTVQTTGGYPLVRAYFLALKSFAEKFGFTCSLNADRDAGLNQRIFEYCSSCTGEILTLQDELKSRWTDASMQDMLHMLASSMSDYMWAWEDEPRSIAHGILDDITYDWFGLIKGMFQTGGRPFIATEEELKEANELAEKYTDIPADPTGTSGLGGLLAAIKQKAISRNAKIALLFTGVKR